ncbi:MAG: hypothetical protein JNK40_01860 [Chromatiales bacterium]|nr:hypothetical protein [Chromatiales bacterium]
MNGQNNPRKPRIPLNHRGRRPRFFSAGGTDELMSMVLELTAELWVVKKRLYLLERVAGQSGVPLTPQIEAYELDPAEVAELDERRSLLISTVLRSLEADPVERGKMREEMESIGSPVATAEGTA